MKANLLSFLPKSRSKLLTYTAGTLLAISTLNSCITSVNNDRFEKNNNNTELPKERAQSQATSTNTINYETKKTPDKPILSDAQKKAIAYMINDYCDGKRNNLEITERSKNYLVITNKDRDYGVGYSVDASENTIILDSGKRLRFSLFPLKITIRDIDNDYFQVSGNDCDWATYTFRKDGTNVTQSDIQNERQNKRQAVIQKQLDDVSFFDNTNKKMLAHVVAYMNINKLDILDQNGYVEAYGENGKYSYEFVVRQGSDNSLYGVAIAMPPNNQSASRMFAFSCTDKSSPSTDRYIVTKKEAVQTEIGDPATSDNEYKYQGGTTATETEHKVDDWVTRRGLLGGAAIIPIEWHEQSFTKTYLEGATHSAYTVEKGEDKLKFNGVYAF